jgi:hypothetical protein
MSKMRIGIGAAMTILGGGKHSSPCKVILCFDLKPRSNKIRNTTVRASPAPRLERRGAAMENRVEAVDRATHLSRITMCQW